MKKRQEAFDLLEKNDSVTIDITALLTAERLEILDVLKNKFTKLLIAQSTIDLLQEAISDRKGMGSRGYSTIGKDGEQFVREEITPEIIKTQTEYLERVKSWAKSNCTITPCKTIPKVEKRKELKEILGMSFLETILIAKEQNSPLYTDDFGTKALAKSEEFNVLGVWTQVIMMHALAGKQMTDEAYNKATIRLVQLGYRHTTISGAILLEAAKQANWVNAKPYTDILETLRGPQMEVKSTVGVFIEFLSLLSQQPILDPQRDSLIIAALDVLTDQRDAGMVIHLVRGAVQIRLRLLPFAEARIQQVISAWEALRMGPGKIGF